MELKGNVIMVYTLHSWFIVAHILVGAVGLLSFWVPVVGRKGGGTHRRWGSVFARCMLTVGVLAIGISGTTLIDPVGTHPHMDFEAGFIAAIFGWMMLYLAILTINLAWYGLCCVRNRQNHAANRDWRNLALQAVLFVATVNCVIHGIAQMQPLMIGISTIGFATVGTNLWFILHRAPERNAWLRQHLKGLVGAGISVYTAFFAFGAVRIAPQLALSPVLWATPCIVGLAIIFWHWWDIERKARQRIAMRPSRTALSQG
jgi:hypothetical protein